MAKQIVGQPTRLVALTEVSGTDYENGAGLLYVGTFGDVIVDGLESGTNVTLKNVASGSILPIYIKKIYSGSTATDLVMLEGPVSNRG